MFLCLLLAGADPGILERGPGKGVKPWTERWRRERRREASPENLKKIRCDFMQSGIYFGAEMASDIIQNGALQNKKQ